MMREFRPDAEASGHRYCVIAARFNEPYVRRLVDAALGVLRQRGTAEDGLDVAWVPGSFEVPLACRWAAESRRYDAILAFGLVLRGETEHFRLVADAASQGILRVSLDTGVPVLNGVLAAYDAEQAAARTGGTLGNRGAEIALAAVQMVRLRREFEAA